MRSNRFWAAVSKALAVIAVTLVLASTLVPGAWAAGKYKVLHQFKGLDGSSPFGLVFDKAGNLYGTTYGGGAQGLGTVFQLTRGSGGAWTETVLHSFAGGADGATPWAVLGPAFDAAGNLYGTTWNGGNNVCDEYYSCGTVFELTPNGDGTWTESVIYNFAGDATGDGGWPTSTPVFDAAGNLYGTTPFGGGMGGCSMGCGVVFELTPNADGSWAESLLYEFGAEQSPGYFPWGGVIVDTLGNLYGTTVYGGETNSGTVFELTPTSGGWEESVLYSFNGQVNPRGGVIFDTAGNLYGRAKSTVFQLTPNGGGTWTETVLHHFTGGENWSTWSGLSFDSKGNLYGTTTNGGAGHCKGGCGVVFKLTLGLDGKWRERVIHQFTGGKDGGNPQAGVIFDGNGNLYGTTGGGGIKGAGVVFEITP